MAETVLVTGMAVLSALGRGAEAQLSATPAFGPVRRFDVRHRRVQAAATSPDAGSLTDELAGAVETACAQAGLDGDRRSGVPLLLAAHADPGACEIAERTGLAGPRRVYTTACVSAGTALADAATLIRLGRAERVVVAAGYLVEPDQYALFDAGKALAADGVVRPFSAGRQGLLLGDGVAAVVLEAGSVALEEPLAELAGWSRAGDAHHPCQPHPAGRGLAAAIQAALDRAGVRAEEVGYVNANATGTGYSDPAEAAALQATGLQHAAVSSTKSVHGHALEASGLLEFVVTIQALRAGKLPVNAGFTAPDPDCPVDVITDAPRPAVTPYALTLNSAFGGANTALLVRVPPTSDPADRRCPESRAPRTDRADGRCPESRAPRIGADTEVRVVGSARWAEAEDGRPPGVAGFVESSFSPLVAAVADACLDGRTTAGRMALVLASASGDRVSAEHVARVVGAGDRVGPLFFFQSVPNSISGYVTARWGLRGPVVCLSPVGDPLDDALAEARLLFDDGACEQALVVLVEQDATGLGTAAAVLVTAQVEE